MTTDDAKTYLSKREIPRLFESLMTGLMYHRPTDHIQYLIDCLTKVHDKGQENITWSSFVDIRRSKTPLPPISNDKKRPSSKGSSRPTSRTRTPKGEEILSLNMGNIEDSIISRVMSPASSGLPISRINSPALTEPLPVSGRSGVISPITSRSVGRPPSGRSVRSADKVETSREETTPRDVRTKSPPLPAIQSTEKLALPNIPIVLVMGAPGSEKDKHVEKLLNRYSGWQHLNMGPLIKDEIKNRGDAQSKWRMVRDLLSRGEVAPQDVIIEVLTEALKKCTSAKGVIVTGFPRNLQQVGDYEQQICRVDLVFMIDCEETKATEKLLRRGKNSNRPEDSMSAIATRMNYFKAHSLAAAKYYDDQGKLIVIDGDCSEDEVQYEIGKAFDNLFFSKHGSKPIGEAPPKSAESCVPDAPTYKPKYEDQETTEPAEPEAPLFEGAVPQPPTITVEDTGRKPGLPTCPIIFVSGGPGSGKGTQCGRVIKRYPDFVHLSMGDIIRTEISTKGTADEKWGMISQLVSKGEMAPEEDTINLLKEQLQKHSSAKAFIIEGFPRDQNQVEAFYKTIGGLNFVMLFDCEEYFMQTRLMKRGKESGRVDDNLTAISNRINFYKYKTLPVMKYFDDLGKLVVLDADKDVEEMFYDIARLLDFAFFGKPGDKDKVDSKDEVDTEDKVNTEDKVDSKDKVDSEDKVDKEDKVDTEDKVDSKEKVDSEDKIDSKDKVDTEDKVDSKEKVDSEDKIDSKDKVDTEDKDDTVDKGDKSLDEQQAEAAIKIQAGFRGFMVRSEKQTAPSQQQPSTSNDEENKEEIDAAAARIQASFRGYQTRQELRALNDDCLHQDSQQASGNAPDEETQEGEVKTETDEHPAEEKSQEQTIPVQEEVIEATIQPEGASNTGNNIENPAHTQELDKQRDTTDNTQEKAEEKGQEETKEEQKQD